MYAGRVCERGTAEEIFYNPAHEYTKGLLHSIPKIDSGQGKADPHRRIARRSAQHAQGLRLCRAL